MVSAAAYHLIRCAGAQSSGPEMPLQNRVSPFGDVAAVSALLPAVPLLLALADMPYARAYSVFCHYAKSARTGKFRVALREILPCDLPE